MCVGALASACRPPTRSQVVIDADFCNGAPTHGLQHMLLIIFVGMLKFDTLALNLGAGLEIPLAKYW
jgi:hypothetical protein